MQTISTKYIGPSNTKGSRIKAVSSSGDSITRSKDSSLNGDDPHIVVAQELKDKLQWKSKMVGGHTDTGMVFVFKDSEYILK